MLPDEGPNEWRWLEVSVGVNRVDDYPVSVIKENGLRATCGSPHTRLAHPTRCQAGLQGLGGSTTALPFR